MSVPVADLLFAGIGGLTRILDIMVRASLINVTVLLRSIRPLQISSGATLCPYSNPMLLEGLRREPSLKDD
jgi:hypothetical protein